MKNILARSYHNERTLARRIAEMEKPLPDLQAPMNAVIRHIGADIPSVPNQGTRGVMYEH